MSHLDNSRHHRFFHCLVHCFLLIVLILPGLALASCTQETESSAASSTATAPSVADIDSTVSSTQETATATPSGTALDTLSSIIAGEDSTLGTHVDASTYSNAEDQVVFSTTDSTIRCVLGTQQVYEPTSAAKGAATATTEDVMGTPAFDVFITHTVPAAACETSKALSIDIHALDQHYCYGTPQVGSIFTLWSGGYSAGECRGDISLGALCMEDTSASGDSYCQEHWFDAKVLAPGAVISTEGITCMAGASSVACAAPDGSRMEITASDYSFS